MKKWKKMEILLYTFLVIFTGYMFCEAFGVNTASLIDYDETELLIIRGVSYFLIAIYVWKKYLWGVLIGSGVQIGLQLYEYFTFEQVKDFIFGVREYHRKEIYLVYAIGYGCVFVIACIGILKKIWKKAWKLQWLYGVPAVIAITSLIYKFLYLKGYFEEMYGMFYSKHTDSEGYNIAYMHLWVEIVLILVLIVLIMDFNKKEVKKEEFRVELIPAAIFLMLGGMHIWEFFCASQFCIEKRMFDNESFVIFISVIMNGIGAICTALGLMYKKKILIIVGCICSLLYVVTGMSVPKWNLSFVAISYAIAYALILVLTVISIWKKNLCINSKWLWVPGIVLITFGIYRGYEILVDSQNYLMRNYWMFDICICGTLFWVLQGQVPSRKEPER